MDLATVDHLQLLTTSDDDTFCAQAIGFYAPCRAGNHRTLS